MRNAFLRKHSSVLLKSICIITLMSLLFTSLILYSSASTVKGDVDGDSQVTVSDARLVLRAAINLEQYTKTSALYINGNVDNDSTLTVSDARTILRVAIGLESFGGAVTTQKSYSIQNKVIVDNSYCKFTIVSVDPNGFWGFTLKALCENKTSKKLMFAFDNSSIMGYMIDPLWATEVAPGKKSNVEISFSSDTIKECGITWVDEISFLLRVYDSDDWSADPFVNSIYTIYPTGLNSSQIVYPNRVVVSGEKIIVDNKDITFIIQSVDPNGFWGYTLNCYIYNKTTKNMMVSWDDVSINGYMIDPFWATEVSPGKRTYTSITFSDDSLAENGISKVNNIEFTLYAYDNDNWFSDYIIKNVYTYNP